MVAIPIAWYTCHFQAFIENGFTNSQKIQKSKSSKQPKISLGTRPSTKTSSTFWKVLVLNMQKATGSKLAQVEKLFEFVCPFPVLESCLVLQKLSLFFSRGVIVFLVCVWNLHLLVQSSCCEKICFHQCSVVVTQTIVFCFASAFQNPSNPMFQFVPQVCVCVISWLKISNMQRCI